MNQPLTGWAHFPQLVTAADGRRWLRLLHEPNQSLGTSRQDYAWPHQFGDGAQTIDDRPRRIALEFEFMIADSANAEVLVLWHLAGRAGGLIDNITLRQGVDRTVIRALRGGMLVDTPLAGIPHLAMGQPYSVRLLAWASAPGEHNGQLAIWIAPGSITDRSIIGVPALGWVNAVTIVDLDAEIFERLSFKYHPTSKAITVGPRPSLCVRTLWQGDPDALPSSPDDGRAAWFDMHRNTIERSGIEWANGSYTLRSTCVVHEGVTPCSAQCNALLRLYPSPGAYDADEPIAMAPYKVPRSEYGYRRVTGLVSGLLPDTHYVYEWRLLARDHAYNAGGLYRVRGKPGHLFTPPARGLPFTIPPHIEPTACRTQDREANSAKRHRGLEGWPDDRFRLIVELGDDRGGGYMDEVVFHRKEWDADGDGVAEAEFSTEGAETRQQMADQAAMISHAFSALEEARYWLYDTVGDDHERMVNDAAGMDLLAEGRRWADGVQITPWRKRGVSAANARYGFPHAVQWNRDIPPDLSAEYSRTPREVAETLIDHFREWSLDIVPRVGSAGDRLDASQVEKYPGVRFGPNDAGYYVKYYGPITLVVCDTRLSMTRDPARNGPLFFNWAKDWVIAKIRTSPGPGLALAVPGLLQGYCTGAIHKRNDCIASYLFRDVPSVEDEVLQIFYDAVELNPRLKWAIALVGDSHWVSLDGTMGDSFSPKFIAQLHDGAAQALAQDPAELGDTAGEEDFLYLTSFGITARTPIRARTRWTLFNGESGLSQVLLWQIGEGQTLERAHLIGR